MYKVEILFQLTLWHSPHLNRFSFRWTVETCSFKVLLCPNVCNRTRCSTLELMLLWYWFITLKIVKITSVHWSHSNGFSPVCTRMWMVRWLGVRNLCANKKGMTIGIDGRIKCVSEKWFYTLLHTWHWCGSWSLLCIFLMCCKTLDHLLMI